MIGLLSSEVLYLVNIIGIQKRSTSRGLNLSICVFSVQNKDVSIVLLSDAYELVFQSSWLELLPEFKYVHTMLIITTGYSEGYWGDRETKIVT